MRVAALAVAAALGGIAGWATTKPAFDPNVWAKADYWSGGRNPMADDLVRTGVLLGKSQAEVIDLLGPPPLTGYFSEWDVVYRLGPERSWLSLDSEWLVLRMKDGHVTDARLVRD